MTTQAVILCGGLGKRLRPITKSIPKPLAVVSGRPFIFHLLEQLKIQGIKKVVLLTGYLGDMIQKEVGDGKSIGLNIVYSHGPTKWDTGRRLWEAKDLFNNEFLLLYSDNFSLFNLKKLKRFHKLKKLNLTLSVVSKIPGNISLTNKNIVSQYNNKRSTKLKYVEIGYMIVNKNLVFKEFKNPNCNFSSILKKMSSKKKVAAVKLEDNYYSISDIKRLSIINKFLKPKKILLIDRDGVINLKATTGRYINKWSEFHFISRTLKSMKKLSSQGFSFIVITNQAGIGRGITKLKNLNEIHNKMIRKLSAHGIKILKVYFCPHDWKKECECRKPKPGMLFKASKEFFFRLDKTFFIGDDPRDIEAAERAGSNGILWKNDKNYPDIDEIINQSFVNL
jgi:histidinol-phosphate phosphatase family protein